MTTTPKSALFANSAIVELVVSNSEHERIITFAIRADMPSQQGVRKITEIEQL